MASANDLQTAAAPKPARRYSETTLTSPRIRRSPFMTTMHSTRAMSFRMANRMTTKILKKTTSLAQKPSKNIFPMNQTNALIRLTRTMLVTRPQRRPRPRGILLELQIILQAKIQRPNETKATATVPRKKRRTTVLMLPIATWQTE